MQHLEIRLGNRRYILCDLQTTPDGKPTGYGSLLRHLEQSIRAAAALDATLFLIRPAQPLNATVCDLDSPDIRMIGQSDWRAGFLHVLWWAAAPVRNGAPLLWLASGAASRVRPLVEAAKHWTRRRGWRRIDGALDRFGHRCRRASHSYEKRVGGAWQAVLGEARERARTTGSKRHRVRLRLRPDTQMAVDQLVQQAGIDPARPIVTLHVRESGYRQRPAVRQQQLDRLRDARIDTYRPAVTWLVDRGYQVIRIGDSTMTPCRWHGVVDLATAPWRTEACELWATLHSRFFVCGDSGPYLLGQLAGVPCLSVNVFRLGYNTIRANDRYIVKRVFDRVRGRCLSIAEQLSEAFVRGPLDLDRYEWIDNTPDEIREAVEDMVALLDDPDQPRTAVQKHHDQLLADLAARWKPDQGPSERLMFRRGGTGTISPRFAACYLDPAPGDRLEHGPGIR